MIYIKIYKLTKKNMKYDKILIIRISDYNSSNKKFQIIKCAGLLNYISNIIE